MHDRNSSGLRIGCIAVILAVIALIALEEWQIGAGRFMVYVAAESVKERMNRIPFNSSDWKNPRLVSTNIRIRMVDDLLKRHRLVGMTTAEIEKLLGKPATVYTPGQYSYYLGPKRGWIRIDAEILLITFDKSGRVKSAKIEVT